MEILDSFRTDKFPHIWCSGCGHGIVMGALVRAMNKLDLDHDKTVIVSGIGCSSRATGYLNFDTLHTTHGRALAFATGIKFSEPELDVIVITGDGDCTAIGGNHLIHAARRNINITTIMFNNSIYGMTSGQYSPLTPQKAKATTAPYGNIEPNFDPCELVQGAGATYVARGTAYHIKKLTRFIKRGIEHNGFSFIDAVSQCPTNFGRKNGFKSAVEMMQWQKENTITIERAAKASEKEVKNKILVGELHHNNRPEYTAKYEQVIEKAQKGGDN
ncbi:MAG: 2-oxoglutarate ferredoxin oxidoreductase subunit beta [Candidatus Frackibacter sp. T328-2]|nr:MAG: 2-oxoglutarate ferredoxin oxidoreductase subunit beta [Candidatus Frackibacter sp. T328-2]